MKDRTTKVNGFVEKAGMVAGSELKVSFPEKIAEIHQLMGKKKFGKLEIEIKEEAVLNMLWRGFTLHFQGSGEVLTEAEKADRKKNRKADNSEIATLRKLAKDKGIPLAQLLKNLSAIK